MTLPLHLRAPGAEADLDLCEFKFKASLVYIVSSRTTKATKRNHVSKNQKPNQNKQTNKKIQSQKRGSLWRHFFLSTVTAEARKRALFEDISSSVLSF